MSNKRSIQWQQECIDNMNNYIESCKKRINILQEDITHTEKIVQLREYQIELAIKKGLVEFDNEKFGIKKKRKEWIRIN